MPCPDSSHVRHSDACAADWPVLQLQQNLAIDITVSVTGSGFDATGGSSSSAGPVYSSSSAGPGSAVYVEFQGFEENYSVRMWLMQYPGDPQVVEVSGRQTSPTTFVFHFTKQNLSKPGLFLGDIFIFDAQGDPVYVKKTFVEIEPNATDAYNRLPLTISELRLAIRDNCLENNYLLDDVQFTNREIHYCMRKPVDQWNEEPPSVRTYSYADFPYRYQQTEAAIGHLLNLAAHNYRRNSLQYNAGGRTVSDKEKAPEYERAAEMRLQKYQDFMTRKKVEINISNSYGGFEGATW
jgi:hypothetical protein